jgi:hypothetical protein
MRRNARGANLFQRDETTFPVQYIGANVPQAWATGSIFMLTQAT